jgi:SAP domain-containing new25/Domain of unknown function (DUF6434)
MSADEFLSWYWLKWELVDACRACGLSSAGQKPELTVRLAAFLRGHSVPQIKVRKTTQPMPSSFSLAMVIQPGWRCTQDLRKFFIEHCGATFRFNGVVRDMVFNQPGKTLGEVVAAYNKSLLNPKGSTQIIPQNQFNQFLRDFFHENPKATREKALEEWKQLRATKNGLPPLDR